MAGLRRDHFQARLKDCIKRLKVCGKERKGVWEGRGKGGSNDMGKEVKGGER